MFIHNYTSSIIHLNKIENYQNIIPKIENSKEEESPKSESNISENKTNSTFHPSELIDYVFTTYDIEKETKEMIMQLEKEEKQNIEKSNINISKNNEEKNQKIYEINNINNKIELDIEKKRPKKKKKKRQKKRKKTKVQRI